MPRRYKRRYRRRFRKSFRRKRLSTKRYKQWWPDLLYTKLSAGERGVIATPTSPAFLMSNPGSLFGPNDQFTEIEAKQFFHNWALCPTMYDNQPSTIGFDTEVALSPAHAVNYPISYEFPEMKTTGLRYIGYRVMGVRISVTFRAADNTANTSFAAPPYFVTGVPYQMDDPLKGNYWNGESNLNANGVDVYLTYRDVGNLRHGFSRRVKGFGSNSGGEKTFKFMMYPWKVYGMTRQQWLNDPKAFREINESYASGEKYTPYFVMSLADYNPGTQRPYNWDYKYTVFLRWEGQKFLFPPQA